MTLLVLGHCRIILLSDQKESRHEDRLVHIILPLDPKKSHPMTLFDLALYRLILLSDQEKNHHEGLPVRTIRPLDPNGSHGTLLVLC